MYIKELLPVHYLPEHIIWKSTDTIKNIISPSTQINQLPLHVAASHL